MRHSIALSGMTGSASSSHRELGWLVVRPPRIGQTAWILIAKRLVFALVALAGLHVPLGVNAACIEEAGATAGTQLCRAPVPSDWQFTYCPRAGTFLYLDVAQCRAAGGTWSASNCIGATPLTEANLVHQVTLFSQFANNDNPSCGVASDSGWGQTLPSNILCWSGPPVYQNNLLIMDFRILDMSCWPHVYALRNRSLICPTGYASQTLPNGDKVCVRPGECLSNCTGNASTTGFPITHGSGVKVLQEVDYETVGTDLRLVRYYNSFYFFVPRAASGNEPREMGSNWRTNYSKRVYPITGSAFVSAALTYPSGEVQYFDASGNEVINYGKSKTRLVATAQGYQIHSTDDSIDLYDLTGRLLSIQSASGITQTLVYSDGTDGAQSGQGGYVLDDSGNPTTLILPAGLLIRVVDTFGHSLTFGYNSFERVVKVSVPGGGVLAYAYGANRNIAQVTQTDGTQRQYIYNEQSNTANANLPNALTGIIDESGVRYVGYFYDSSGRAVKEMFPSVGTNTNLYQLSFNASNQTTTVTDPLGAVRTYQFQQNNVGILKLIAETQPAATGIGTVSATTTYDANGNIASRTDFNGNTTHYTFDLSRNLEVSRTEAHGTPDARTITTQWHPTFHKPALITEAGRTTAFTYDTAGNMLTRTITDTGTNASRTCEPRREFRRAPCVSHAARA